MNFHQRGQLLRARFRALGGLPPPIIPPPVKRNTQPLTPKQPGRGQPFYGVALAYARPDWVGLPDTKPWKPLGARNRGGKPIVVRLAELAPGKLVLGLSPQNNLRGLPTITRQTPTDIGR